MAGRGRDRGKEWFWRRVLRQWRRSGQGVRLYCVENGLSEASFYAWRRTIEERDGQAARRMQQRERIKDAVTQREQGERLPAFVPVTIAASAPSIEIALGDSRVVRVPVGFDAATLRQLLVVLQETLPC